MAEAGAAPPRRADARGARFAHPDRRPRCRSPTPGCATTTGRSPSPAAGASTRTCRRSTRSCSTTSTCGWRSAATTTCATTSPTTPSAFGCGGAVSGNCVGRGRSGLPRHAARFRGRVDLERDGSSEIHFWSYREVGDREVSADGEARALTDPYRGEHASQRARPVADLRGLDRAARRSRTRSTSRGSPTSSATTATGWPSTTAGRCSPGPRPRC